MAVNPSRRDGGSPTTDVRFAGSVCSTTVSYLLSIDHAACRIGPRVLQRVWRWGLLARQHEPGRGVPPMPALSALIDVARQLSERHNADEEDTSPDLVTPAGFMFLVLCCCFYCGCRERANRYLGCPEDSMCGLGSDGDSEWCNSGCSILFGTAEATKNEVTSRVRV